ncbi:phenylacetate--CoA ligase family protein [Streptomyces viridifaciens]|uniref:phenylacetate--CoA ligase family protein n=1 Tax=Kitasatospora aureofaciens TaxID=1894 RepID=UPI0004BECCDF|nr:phenylacetate--CoA ligase family protein [Streptomyces viridifaciens]UKZ05317.1 phenylacetate--CoA ligase family protein [Streptomyces viridifaciens]
MKINSRSDLEFLERIQREVTAHQRDEEYDETYYASKLTDVWQRAEQTSAYGSLGAFSMRAFHDLPVTSKDQLKARPLDYLRVPAGGGLKYYQTTGTTGTPTPTPRTSQDMIANTVSVAEAWRPLLADGGHRALILLPSDIVPVADLMVGVCEFLGIPHVKAYPYTTGISDWDRIAGLWEVFRPTVLFVAPGVLLQFSQIMKKRGLLEQLREPVELLMLLGEVSTPELREMAGHWWNARAFDASYGSTESGTLAACCAQDRLHLLRGANHFEIADDSGVGPAEAGRTGRLVVTPLNNDARPLLRLDMGDEVSLSGDCPCGADAPVVTVHGRGSDGTAIKGSRVRTRDLEGVVYSNRDVMGYLIEIDEAGAWARLLLERDPSADRNAESGKAGLIQERTHERLGFRWDEVRFVNRLPVTTKSGGSQKSWKRSNFRVVDEVVPA